MIQATATELQSSENFKLQTFWEDQAVNKTDKAKLQQMILKINILSPIEGRPTEGRPTEVAPKQGTVIGYEPSYEKAPTDEINTTLPLAGATPMSGDEQKLSKLEFTISGL